MPAEDLASAHRIQFYELICVTRGACTHVIDFDPIHCGPGSLLVSHPSQTEQFDVQSVWDGWLVLFRPEFLFSRSEGRERVTAELNLVALLAGLPAHVAELQGFQRFRDLVEQSFRRWHHVGAYANALGCTEKTLTRAAFAVVGSSAKAFIAGRLALEAKRLLVHTTLQVGVIAVDVGFQDASNS